MTLTRICEVPLCGRKRHGGGLCHAHYQQKRNNRELTPIRRNGFKLSDEALLESLKTQIVVDANTCWIWQGVVDSDGYGRVTARGKSWSTHRLVWSLHRGVTPQYTLDHICRVRLCCNPEHLEDASGRINTLRAREYNAVLNKLCDFIESLGFNVEDVLNDRRSA